MKRGIPKAAIVMTLGAVCVFGMAAGGAKSTQVTFTKDVAPILLNRCVECHRPGEVAPMSLLTYQDVRPWAKSIKEKVLEHSMPPWFADPQYGEFENDRRLPQKEIDTLVAWVNAGAPKGVSVPAEGVVPYKYFTVPTNFTEDKWIQGVELRSGNRGVVHHIIAFVLEPGQKGTGEGPTGNVLGGTAPGDPPTKYPDGMAKFLKAGSKLVLQMHYTPNGEPAKDRSSVGIFFAKAPVKKTARTGTAMNARFVIPPGDPNYEVKSGWTAKEDVHLFAFMPHMHVRGKDFTFTAVYPDGRSEIVVRVPKYDFNWQLAYRLKRPLALPKGSRIECVAHFDNSASNKYNPDPAKEVRWGDQTWEEMMIGWFSYTRDTEEITPPSTASANK